MPAVEQKNNNISYCAITVVDESFATARDQEWIQSQVDTLKPAFEEITLERGEVINILGMNVRIERDKGRAVIKQKRFVDKLTKESKVTKSAITSATADLLYKREDSELMRDPLNAALIMYSLKGAYREISFPVVHLASKYNKAMGEEHSLVFAPMSLQLFRRLRA